MEDNLPSVLDGDDAPVTVEELEGVVRRAGQRRQATLVAAAAALLVVGGVGGAMARGSSNARPIGMAGEPRATADKAHGGAAVSGSAFAGQLEQFTPLFRREANGVSVRTYQLALPPGPTPPDPVCAVPTSFVQAELSSAASVGYLFAPEPADKAKLETNGITVLAADSFGVQEGEPATGAVVRSGPGIASVRITTPTGTDTMTPQNGITVLVVTGKADGTIEGLGTDGAVVATQPIIPPPSGDRIITSPRGPACALDFPCPLPTPTADAGPTPPPTVKTTKEAKASTEPDVSKVQPVCEVSTGAPAFGTGPGAVAGAPAAPVTSVVGRTTAGSTSISTTSTITVPASAAP